MHRIDRLAQASVGRGFGFAMLAIITFMVGLSSDLLVALRAGGYLCLVVCLVMMWMALRASVKPYKRTELWLMLDPADRPQPAVAQLVISAARREALLVFALRSAWLSAATLAVATFWGYFL